MHIHFFIVFYQLSHDLYPSKRFLDEIYIIHIFNRVFSKVYLILFADKFHEMRAQLMRFIIFFTLNRKYRWNIIFFDFFYVFIRIWVSSYKKWRRDFRNQKLIHVESFPNSDLSSRKWHFLSISYRLSRISEFKKSSRSSLAFPIIILFDIIVVKLLSSSVSVKGKWIIVLL